jgi:dTDP-4-dehydrorhamnose 3,5-epimerase-like enzyme
MTNEEYTKAVDAGIWPNTPDVPLPEPFADERGNITNLLFTPINSVADISSVRGSVRANHYHRTDWHYTLVSSGKVAYFEREIGSTEVPEPRIYGPGQMFFTPPMREHAMLFLEDSLILTFAKNVRNHENHEADVVRVEFVTPAVVDKYLP